MRGLWPLLVTIAAAQMGSTPKWVIVSQPTSNSISYIYVGNAGPPSDLNPEEYKELPSKVLLEKLAAPTGISVSNKKLYVAEQTGNPGQITVYDLTVTGEDIEATNRRVLVDNITVKWIAADGFDNVFFTDGESGTIYRVDASTKALKGAKDAGGAAVEIYSESLIPEVSKPNGITADNLHVYWTNMALGSTKGSLVKGVEHPPSQNKKYSVQALARNVAAANGVCVAQSNVFFTDDAKIYAVKKTGSGVVEVASSLNKPRGCSWDTDGTVYVAMEGEGAVYAFPGNMRMLTPTTSFVKVGKVGGSPLDVTVFSGAAQWSFFAAFFLIFAMRI